VIDKGIPTTGLLAHVLIAKYLDHLPLYRQEGIFGRAGCRSRNRPGRVGGSDGRHPATAG
jgi:transposase